MAFCVLCATVSGMSASEPYFSADFDATAENPLAGWTCRGAGKTAKDVAFPASSGTLSALFPAGCDAYRVLSFPEVVDAAYSNSTTTEGGKVDEWLVSPRISVPEGKDALMLRFNEIAAGSIRPGDYDVYVSEGGEGPDDFTTRLHSGRPKGLSNGAVSGTVCVPMNGFGGKDVRVAFVNRSNGTFLLGFGAISIVDWHAEAMSRIPEFVPAEGDVEPAFDLSLATPRECKGFVARLYVDGEDVREYSSDADLSAHFEGTVAFTPALQLSFGQKKDYRLEVSPADSSLPLYAFEGSVTCAEGFPGVCVMEEATGTWCPACVRGGAAIAKYSDDYPGQFFGIAVHERDPMTVTAYNTALKEDSRITSFPSGWFNRTVRDDPQKQNHVRDFVSRRLPSKVAVDAVFHHEEDGVEKLTVFYSPQLCYDTENADLRAVAVITEDHCKGTGSGWSQQNAYSGASVEKVGGEDWLPYFDFFIGKGAVVRASEMEYDHVAWGVYNDYYGSASGISASWKAYTPQRYSITFDVQRQQEADQAGVQELSGTAITVILLDGKTGQVVGADKMEASEYTEGAPSGLGMAGTGTCRVFRDGDDVVVVTDRSCIAEIFDMSGKCLLRESMAEGRSRFRAGDASEPLIVRVITGSHTELFRIR